ncbi:MAG TPA: M28 family peptidase [Candidatus Deferrimicrobium sp.]|nr:M28 family peptidase [Candidatus Deferrimicrobium sp.]
MIRTGLGALMALSVAASCAREDISVPTFDGQRAYRYLCEQVAFGPRVPGGLASANCRAYFRQHFVPAGASIDSQSFSFFDLDSGAAIPMVNLIATFRGSQSHAPGIVLMAHYDSRPRTDYAGDPALLNRPIDGANDGASGAAVLMELANLFTKTPPPCDVDLVLVDGEDWGKAGNTDHYLLGSREFSRRGIRGRYRFGIIIDMVGDSSQQIYREAYSEVSARSLNDAVWGCAARLGVASFRDSVKHSVIDDHLSLISSGVPAVDIIDFDYPYWHTENDTPDKCSPTALANVGRVLAELIYNPSLWPKQ